ncbi:MAG: transposase [Methylococcales symbiont of Hymedesmia sp. n. MRB-2018]|nr:MAG: transposase [Methylococcales symbiont of Hymedesmia sp. n. MRB-2018]
MLRKLRVTMGDQNSLYKLTGTIELDDAFVGGRHKGKRGRGAEGKTAILFVAMKAIPNVDKENVRTFAQKNIEPRQTLNTEVTSKVICLEPIMVYQDSICRNTWMSFVID